MKRNACKLTVAVAALAVTACSRTSDETAQSPAAAPSAAVPPLTVTSAAFPDRGAIPVRYTCDGEGVSPALEWSEPPLETKSLAVVVDDPDASKKGFVHWVLYDLSPEIRVLPEALQGTPAGAHAGKNDFGKMSYGGPCPPSGRHRYVFHVYALDVVLPDLGAATGADVEKAMNGHVVARGQIIGTYEKSPRPRT